MFNNKVVNIIAWVLWIISSVYLIVSGVSQEDFKGILVLILGIVDGVIALYKVIKSLINKHKGNK